ncbi:MAG: hypothetical protein GY810_31545 [Aureispira sp.]|nr:hypothetical protein [Aureispira sp.]
MDTPTNDEELKRIAELEEKLKTLEEEKRIKELEEKLAKLEAQKEEKENTKKKLRFGLLTGIFGTSLIGTIIAIVVAITVVASVVVAGLGGILALGLSIFGGAFK